MWRANIADPATSGIFHGSHWKLVAIAMQRCVGLGIRRYTYVLLPFVVNASYRLAQKHTFNSFKKCRGYGRVREPAMRLIPDLFFVGDSAGARQLIRLFS